jgi:hypothetical protein
MSERVVRDRFGSWVGALEKAGLGVSENYHRRYSDEEYFENLLNIWTHYGRQPFYREMDEAPSKISSGAYEGRFGGWRKALEAFVARMKQDEVIETTEHKAAAPTNTHAPKNSAPVIKSEGTRQASESDNRRGVPLSLRYKVLTRDKFRCVKCGTSPAVDVQCRLHVDHAMPFSRGGKTTPENLQTLCESCNLGKGNRHSE